MFSVSSIISKFLELYVTVAYYIGTIFLALDSFASWQQRPAEHDQYFCTLLLSRVMRLHALSCHVRGRDGWTRLRPVPGDSAITRGDQIRKRNVYCRRRTRLSSLSEIIRPEKGKEEEESFVWRTGSVFPRASDGKYVWLSLV